ncbi:MFS polyamine transporter [Fomitiporia mediterranea MF3/22]|uniref:MFS polyamine transporter n=1 Tax=Fomitiporia mediterranea (strain MF3/22) TaxID=694068 RepID=UPI00044081D4|nr:MFS polyamine transporter [Fomitiporia mediterranea MF3/22]EJC99411.1 MFS polyamine transporter [Fomitiporia mediterranea MF3/22]
MSGNLKRVPGTSVTPPTAGGPGDVPLKEKNDESEKSRTQVGEDNELPDQQSTDLTRRNSLASQQTTASEHVVSLKALEAGFAGVREKSGKIMIVDWDGLDDPCNPLNWSYKKKWIATLIVSAFTFISPVSSAMIAPASDQLASQFGITNTAVLAMSTSVFILGYAFGPLFLGPLSEMYGRSRVLQIANIWYLIWNTACGGAQNTAELVVFRFLAGLGGSAPLSIGGGVLGDCWRAEERGQAIALYSLAPLLGPVIGPICGSWIAEKSTWRWVFWGTSIADGVVQILGLFFLKETFAPILLERKANRLRKKLGIQKSDEAACNIMTPFQGSDRTWQHVFKKAIIRPFALFVREPIIQLMGLYMTFVYGLIYLVITTVPGIYQITYNETVGIAGLNYIALGIGMTGVSQITARLMDPIYRTLKARNGGVGKPEFRLPLMVLGTFCLPIGLFIMGWTAEKHVFWLVPDIGLAFIGAGMVVNFQAIQTYVIDAFTLHAASALAAVSFLRSLAGFGFPLFAPAMYSKLGYGKGDTILAVLAIVIGCPSPWLFWKYGEQIRARSRYAA